MKKQSVLLFSLVLLTFLSGCGQTQAPNKEIATNNSHITAEVIPNDTTSTTQEPTGIIEIKINNFAFSPAELTVKAGTYIKWTNADSAPHIIKSDKFNSPSLSNGQAYMFQFNEKGSYEYICEIHPSMKGKITVE